MERSSPPASPARTPDLPGPMALWKGTNLPSERREGGDGCRKRGVGRQLVDARRSHGFWEGIHNPFGTTGPRAETCRLRHQLPHRDVGEAGNATSKRTTPAPGMPAETPRPSPSSLEWDPLIAEAGATRSRGSAPRWELSVPWRGLWMARSEAQGAPAAPRRSPGSVGRPCPG